MGACIGSLSALVQSVFQPASVRIIRGWQEGREYPLDKIDNVLGRDEHADIALFRDMKVEKKHAVIRRQGARYFFLNNHAPPENTLIDHAAVAEGCELQDGARIQLGNVVLIFQLRAAKVRAKPRLARAAPAAPPLAPGGPSTGIRPS
jgi:predicted component of type VI protein secretion system